MIGWREISTVCDHRQVNAGVIYRFRRGIAWRDLPGSFGAWKRHKRFSTDGTWDRIHARLLAEADAAGDIGWMVSVDSTINRAHQDATTLRRGCRATRRPQDHGPHRRPSRTA